MNESFDLYSYFRVSGSQAARRRAEAKELGIHVPEFIHADIAEKCNLACPGCYKAGGCTEYRERLLTTAEWDSVFREAEQLGVRFIFLSGGEPLMKRDVLERAARYSETCFLVMTNGTLLDNQYYEFFSSHRNLIPILCQEICSDVDLANTGKSSFLYSSLRQAMDKLASWEITYGASVALTRETYQRVLTRGFLGDLQRRQCKGVLFMEYGLSGAERRNLMLEGEVRDQAEEELRILQQEFPDMFFFTFPREGRDSERSLVPMDKMFQITVDGYVCPRLYRNISGGNLKNQSLREILKEDLFGSTFI